VACCRGGINRRDRTRTFVKGADQELLHLVALLWLAAGVAAGQNGFDLSNLTIRRDELVRGGPPRDGIPSIDQPRFIKASDVNFLRDGDRVLSVKLDNEVRAYPLRILNWHEIVNDQIGDRAIAVAYCPLAGAGIVFDRRVNGRKLSFGVSGLLYQSDLVMYDRETESLWPQIATRAVSGPLAGAELRWLPSEDVTWRAWREAHLNDKVLSTETGYARDYSGDAYASYQHSSETTFPVRWNRPELPKKSWVVGVIVNHKPKAYPLDALEKEPRVRDNVADQQIQIAYNPRTRRAEIINTQDGAAVPCTIVYWFAWQAFYPKTELFQH
jgi:Protein of unknown function (DUF3179)